MRVEFEVHPRLKADTAHVTDWLLSRVLLMNDARYAWLILVPRRAGASELHDLTADDQKELMAEISRASAALKVATGADKINTGALGNLVPQLHVHVVARFKSDPAWPGPVWGHSPPRPYEAAELEARIASLSAHL